MIEIGPNLSATFEAIVSGIVFIIIVYFLFRD